MSLATPLARIVKNVYGNVGLAADLGKITKGTGNPLHCGPVAYHGVPARSHNISTAKEKM